MNQRERETLKKLEIHLKGIQLKVIQAKTEAEAKRLRIRALGDTMETLGKLLGGK